MSRFFLLSSLVFMVLGCFVTSSDRTTIVVSLDLSSGPGPARENDGLVHLSTVGWFAAVKVTSSDDMEEQRSEWPNGSSSGDTAEMSLDVPAGSGRSIEVVVFGTVGERVDVFSEASPLVYDLTGGQELVIDVSLTETEYGIIQGTITGPLASQAAYVAAVDRDLGVLYPSQSVTVGTSVRYELAHLPINRDFWIRVTLSDGRTVDQAYNYTAVTRSEGTAKLDLRLE